MFAKIAVISLFMFGAIASIEAVDQIRANTNSDQLSIDSSVTIERERRTMDNNDHNDRYWVSGDNILVDSGKFNGLLTQTQDSRDLSAAPSMRNQMIHANDQVRVLGSEIIFIQDQGSQWKVYGKAIDPITYFFYKDVLVGTHEKTSSEDWQSYELYLQIPRELYNTTVIDSWEDEHFVYEVVRSPKN